MIPFDLALVAAAVAGLAGAAAAVSLRRTPGEVVGPLCGTAVAAAGLGATLAYEPAARDWLILDAASLPRVVMTGLWLLAVFAVLPRRHADTRVTAALLGLAAVDLALAVAPAGLARAALFVGHVAMVTLVLPSGPARRVAAPYLGAAAVCAVLGTFLGGSAGGVLILAAVALAMGVPPFHSWAVGAYTLAPTTIAVAVSAPMATLALVAHEPIDLGAAASGVAAFLAVAALLAAALSVVQRDLARAVGLLTVSVQSIVLMSMLATDTVGHLGGLMMWNATGLALLGLGLVSAALRSRTGTVRVDGYSGLSKQMPTFAALFLLFGLAAVGAPGTADFASEDLVLHGALAHDPALLLLLVSAISTQGYAVLHLFYHAFYGPPARQRLADALPRERLALVSLAVLLVATGLAPQVLVDGLPESSPQTVAEAP